MVGWLTGLLAEGALGTAILLGMIAACSSESQSVSVEHSQQETINDGPGKSAKPSRFIACVRNPKSADRIFKAVKGNISSSKLDVLTNENLRGVCAADIVLLAFKSSMMRTILSAPGIAAALEGKLLISVLAGITEAEIHETLSFKTPGDCKGEAKFHIIRAMPNIASSIRASMTLISTDKEWTRTDLLDINDWIFRSIGNVAYIPSYRMVASTTLCSSGPAFWAIMLEAIVDGAVLLGLPRDDALNMSAHTMRGVADLVLNGEGPLTIKDKVATPGGSTMRGIEVLEQGSIATVIINALKTSTLAGTKPDEIREAL